MIRDDGALTSVQSIMLAAKGERLRRNIDDKKRHTGLESFQRADQHMYMSEVYFSNQSL